MVGRDDCQVCFQGVVVGVVIEFLLELYCVFCFVKDKVWVADNVDGDVIGIENCYLWIGAVECLIVVLVEVVVLYISLCVEVVFDVVVF